MKCPVTAIVTAHKRTAQTLETLRKLKECEPEPEEILIHVDAGGDECRGAVARAFPGIRILSSETPVGPGGARNKLIAAATNEIVASFDDDSHPLDRDYFGRLLGLFEAFPEAALITAEVFTRGQPIPKRSADLRWVADFAGGACAYRRSRFLETLGYLPLPVAYGMEEADLALRVHAAGQRVLRASELRVFHDTDYRGHRSAKLVSGTIANAALLVYLRYPVAYWPRGLLQFLSVIWYALRHGRWRGTVTGFLMIPAHVFRNRQYRETLSAATLRSVWKQRRNPSAVVRDARGRKALRPT
jgi:GT2 family glycosyltransferase